VVRETKGQRHREKGRKGEREKGIKEINAVV
jgi:hypothetical protein